MTAAHAAPRRATVATLGVAQTLAWASSYYLPAVLAAPMARELGLATPTVFAFFSLAMVVSALVGPAAGRAIDRRGGRPLLMGTSVLFAAGLLALALAQGPASLLAGWLLLGLAMGAGLYDAAFATLVRLSGAEARRAITGVTLFAGLASTVGWPLSAWMEAQGGWRAACAGWAALHLLVGLPLNARLPRAGPHPAAAPPAGAGAEEAPAPAHPRLLGALLAFVFAAGWFTVTAMATHLPALMQGLGLSVVAAAAVGALIGPAQVGARLFEYGVLSRWHPLLAARVATLAHPAAVAVLWIGGVAAAPAFALVHGVGSGLLTIAKGTLPLAFFGAQGYGRRQGWLTLPSRAAQALAPFLFGLALQRWGPGALWLTAVLGLASFAALAFLPRVAAPQARPVGGAAVSAGASPADPGLRP